jgi:hypothetical protein
VVRVEIPARRSGSGELPHRSGPEPHSATPPPPQRGHFRPNCCLLQAVRGSDLFPCRGLSRPPPRAGSAPTGSDALPRCVILGARRAARPPGPRSSAGQSGGLLIRGSQVRILAGAPIPLNHGRSEFGCVRIDASFPTLLPTLGNGSTEDACHNLHTRRETESGASVVLGAAVAADHRFTRRVKSARQ